MHSRKWLAAAALAAAALAPRVAFGDAITLRWTAPGDDGDVGTAAAYDLRYSVTPFIPDSTWWNGATPVGSMPGPAPAGFRESFTVQGLASGTTYYFVIRTMDEASNVSAFSNVSVRQAGAPAVLDPPTAFTANMAADGLHLSWQPPPSNGGTGYRLYRRTAPSMADSLLLEAPSSQDRFVDGTVQPGARYEYRIVTYEGPDESAPAILAFDVPTAGAGEESVALRSYPNPAKGRVMFRVAIGAGSGAPTAVRLTVYDLSGRRICSILDEALPAGEHTIEWGCVSDGGHQVAPGLYTAILQSPSGRSVVPIAIVP